MKKAKVAEEQPIKEVGTWKVMADGTLKGQYTNPAGITSELTIYPDKLSDRSLIFRLYKYQAVARSDWYDFIEALFAACSVIGLKQVIFRTAR